MAAKTGKYFKIMETLMKSYEFDDKDLITLLRFLAHFKCACDSNKVLEDMGLSVTPNFMKKGPT